MTKTGLCRATTITLQRDHRGSSLLAKETEGGIDVFLAQHIANSATQVRCESEQARERQRHQNREIDRGIV